MVSPIRSPVITLLSDRTSLLERSSSWPMDGMEIPRTITISANEGSHRIKSYP